MRPLILAVLLIAPALAFGQQAEAPPDEAARAYLESLIAKERGFDKYPPLSAGLPDSLPADFLDKGGFLFYDAPPDSFRPLSDLDVLTTPKIDPDVLFEDDHWAALPADQRAVINVRRVRNKELWTYPTGTTAVHRVFRKGNPRQLLDLRMIRKMDDDGKGNGHWAFAIYAEDPDGSGRLHRMTGTEIWSYSIPGPRGPVRATGYRLHPNMCLNCHADMGHLAYQYPEDEFAGPCAFGGVNPKIKAEWGPAFEKRFGYWPFVDR